MKKRSTIIFDTMERNKVVMKKVNPDFQIHTLKTDPESYNDIFDGLKSSTVRVNDREYEEGDYLILRKTKYTGAMMAGADGADPYPLIYTGRSLLVKVTHKHDAPGMVSNHVVLSFCIIDRFPGIPTIPEVS